MRYNKMIAWVTTTMTIQRLDANKFLQSHVHSWWYRQALTDTGELHEQRRRMYTPTLLHWFTGCYYIFVENRLDNNATFHVR